jgi:hypothetical protein
VGESVVVVTDPLLATEFVQYRVIVPLLSKLSQRYDLTLAAPALAESVVQDLEGKGIRAVSGGAQFPKLRHSRDEVPSYVLSWIRDSILAANQRGLEHRLAKCPGLRINYSMTTAIRAGCWYIQAHPLETALDLIQPSVGPEYRVAIGLSSRLIGLLDWRHLVRTGALSERIYASSQYLVDWYSARGVPVRGTIPVYLADGFYPSTSNPSRDYVLAYMGKELDTKGLRALARTGIPVKLFGSKSEGWVRKTIGNPPPPNIEVLGRVSSEELRSLYTNALFTAFMFTEESFGLVPVESMACGTPVLTYAQQGPAETVMPGRTGWLAHSILEFVSEALRIFTGGYPAGMRTTCLQRAEKYSLNRVADTWRTVIAANLSGTDDPETVRPTRISSLYLPSVLPSSGARGYVPWVPPLTLAREGLPQVVRFSSRPKPSAPSAVPSGTLFPPPPRVVVRPRNSPARAGKGSAEQWIITLQGTRRRLPLVRPESVGPPDRRLTDPRRIRRTPLQQATR